ncbi:MAG: tetratricopeptide repeat protein [Pseudomonadota bacterium]
MTFKFPHRLVRASCAAAGALGVAALLAVASPAERARAADARFETPQAAYTIGREAFRAAQYDRAVTPLRYAADRNVFLANYYLAEILSDPRNASFDSAEAFRRYLKLIAETPDVDPAYDYRAQFVARAYVKAGRYYLGELHATGVPRSPSKARRLFGYAANYLDFPEAQYQFARMLIRGEGGSRNAESGKHYLSTLSRKGHAGAQGTLAEMFFTGSGVEKRPDFALALSTLALENARDDHRIWIAELHHEIRCTVTAAERAKATSLLADWQQKFKPSHVSPRGRTDVLSGATAKWTCERGPAIANGPSWPERDRLEAMHGSMFGLAGGTKTADDAREETQLFNLDDTTD